MLSYFSYQKHQYYIAVCCNISNDEYFYQYCSNILQYFCNIAIKYFCKVAAIFLCCTDTNEKSFTNWKSL